MRTLPRFCVSKAAPNEQRGLTASAEHALYIQRATQHARFAILCVQRDSCILPRMSSLHPKSVRRRLLTVLYERYLKDPLEMLTPEDVVAESLVPREDILANIHYLGDKGYVELMMGYNPPWFAAVRITAKGIDLVENRYEFNLHYPPAPGDIEEANAAVPLLMERLVEEADFSPLDGEERKCLLRDVMYLRDELARPVVRWRERVITTMLQWIEGYFEEPETVLPVLPELRAAIETALKEE